MLDFTVAAPTPTQHAEGVTAYEAKAHGTTYVVLGTLADPMTSRRRTFRAFRVTGKTGHTLHPAAEGGEHKTRAAAYAQAERDLEAVLADRRATEPSLDEIMAQDPVGPVDAEVAPEPDSIEYELGKLRSAFDLACKSRNLWRDRALKVGADPATEDNVTELVDRIVRRAQYTALKAMLGVLDGWVDSCLSTNAAVSSSDRITADEVIFQRHDVRRMVNDAARELGTAEPWAGDRG